MQSEPAFCGLGSLAMVLNALNVDPGKQWKGVWRWYADDMLECCAPLETVKKEGLTFAQMAATARGNGLDVIPKQANHTTFDEFISDLKTVTKSDNMHMVVSFSRQKLGQTGDGHFSPVGAYCPVENQVLVMDTARFKYPSYFVDARLLYDAMFPVDQVTQLPRGYLLLSKGDSKPLPLCKINAEKLEWNYLLDIFLNVLPEQVGNAEDLQTIVNTMLMSIPHNLHFFISIDASGFDLAGNKESTTKLGRDLRNEIKKLQEETSRHPLYKYTDKLELNCNSCDNEIKTDPTETLSTLAVLFLLSIPRELMLKFSPSVCKQVFAMREPSIMESLPLLNEEVSRMSKQWGSMLKSHCACGNEVCQKS